MSKQLPTKDLVQRINTSWRKTTDGVLETALLCHKANGAFHSPADRRHLVEQLHFDQSTVSKLFTSPEFCAMQHKNYTAAAYAVFVHLRDRFRKSKLATQIRKGRPE